MGDDGTIVVAIATNWRAASLQADEQAMLAFAEKLTAAPHTIAEGDVAGLRAAGFSDLDILDITLLTCYRHFINRLGDALGVELDEPFKKDGRLVAGIEAAMGLRKA